MCIYIIIYTLCIPIILDLSIPIKPITGFIHRLLSCRVIGRRGDAIGGALQVVGNAHLLLLSFFWSKAVAVWPSGHHEKYMGYQTEELMLT